MVSYECERRSGDDLISHSVLLFRGLGQQKRRGERGDSSAAAFWRGSKVRPQSSRQNYPESQLLLIVEEKVLPREKEELGID